MFLRLFGALVLVVGLGLPAAAEFERIHGKDERASVAVLARGVLDLHALLQQLGPPAGE